MSRSILFVLFLMIGINNTYAGSYFWSGQGGAGLTQVEYSSGNPVFTNIPAPTSVFAQVLSYDPTQFLAMSTTGNTTTFMPLDGGVFSVTGCGSPLWPGFYGIITSVEVTVPTVGLDQIEFDSTTSGGSGALFIYAPNGSLSTSTIMPDSLNAFQTYGANNTYAGIFDFSIAPLPGYTEIEGNAFGILGVPDPILVGVPNSVRVPNSVGVPEPTSLIPMLIGLFCVGIYFSKNRFKELFYV